MRRPTTEVPVKPGRFSLRRMVVEDLDEVMRIENQAFKSPWSRELLSRELAHDWSTILIAEELLDGERVVRGFIIYWLVHDEIHVLNVATAEEFRRRGVGRQLLAECMTRGLKAGARLATLEVRRSNAAAINLYASFGFRAVGVRPGYYAEENEDAIVMVLDLPESR